MKHLTLFTLLIFISFTTFAGRPPSAQISVTPSTGYLPLEVQLSGANSSDPEGQIVKYEWSFGDGGIGTGESVSHVYKTNRVENAKLTVTDAEGKKGTAHYIFKFLKDKLPPEMEFEVPQDFQTFISTPLISFLYRDENSKVNFDTSRVILDGQEITSKVVFEANRGLVQFTPEWPLSSGSHVLVVELRDYYDNLITRSLDFSYIQTTPETAFLSAKVIDVDNKPLKGVVVESVAGPSKSQLRSVSNADGVVTLPFLTGGDYRIQFSQDGFVKTNKYITLVRGSSAHLGDVMMAEADSKVTFIGPSGGSATNSSGTISLTVPPNSIPMGLNFNFTEATTGRTLEIPLPNGSHFTYAHDAQPSGTVFSTAADMWIRNLLNFSPGTQIPVGVTNEALGVWSDTGHKGIVSTDGERIDFKVDHFSQYDVNFPTAQKAPLMPPEEPPQIASNNATNSPCPCDSGSVSGSRINLGSGNVSVDYNLPPVIRGGKNISKTLTYSSSSVSRQVIVGAKSVGLNAKMPNGVNVIVTFGDQRHVSDKEPRSGIKESNFFTAFSTKLPNGELLQTGTYRFDFSLTALFADRTYANAAYFGGPPIPFSEGESESQAMAPPREPVPLTESISGWVVVNNQNKSFFGAGWSLSGLEQIFENEETGIVTLVKGNELNSYYMPVNPGAGKTVYQKRVSGEVNNLLYHKGFVYGADCETNQVFRLDSLGRYTTIAGGTPHRHVSLNCPKGIFPSRKGGYYISDSGNKRILYLNSDGSFKVLADHLRGDINDPAYITEDNVLAVHFIDGSEIKTISPYNGAILTMVGDSPDAMFSYSLKKPSQVHYDDRYNLIVLDPELKEVIKFYVNTGNSRVILKNIAAKELAYDDLRKNFYILAQNGELHFWQGWGHSKAHLLDSSEETIKPFYGKSESRKYFKKFNSIAFSQMTGLVLAGDSGLKLRALNSTKRKDSETAYLSYALDRSELIKMEDGSFKRVLPDHSFYEFLNGGKLSKFFDASSNMFENYIYNINGSLSSITLSHNRGSYLFNYNTNKVLESILDPSNRVTNISINSKGQLVSITSPDNQSQSYQYDSQNLMMERTDEADRLTKYTYRFGRAGSVVKPGDRLFQFYDNIAAYLNSNMQTPLASSDVKNYVMSPERRTKGQILGPLGASLADFGDDDTDWISRDERGLPVASVTSEGREIRQTFDTRGNLIERYDQNGKSTYDWNALGKIEKVTDDFGHSFSMIYGQNGLLASIKNPLNGTTSLSYDINDNLVEIINPLSSSTKLNYDQHGNIQSIKDASGAVTFFQRNIAGNLTKITDSLKVMTTFDYDANGRMIQGTDGLGNTTVISYSPTGEIESVLDAKNQLTTFEYNDFGKLVLTRNSANLTSHYAYDLDGNVVSKTTKAGSVINFDYDSKGRLKEKSFVGNITSYKYDSEGKLNLVTDSDSVAGFEYDHHGRLVFENGSHYQGKVEHKYNSRGDRELTTLSIGNDVVIEYTRLFGSMKELKQTKFWVSGVDGQIDTEIDLLGRLKSQTFSNGFKKIVTYDNLSRPSQLQFFNPSFNYLQDLVYNSVGSITGLIENTNGSIKESRYKYDELQRLISEDNIVKRKSYSLDPLGNDQSTGVIHNNVNQVLADADNTYEYDDNGNRLRKTARFSGERFDYTWNHENQLIGVKIYKNGQLSKTLDYKYDGLGRRIVKQVTDHLVSSRGYLRKFIYDGSQVIAVLNENDDLLSAYVFGTEIDQPQSIITDSDQDGDLDVLSLFTDHLGSVRFISNSHGQILEEIHYSAYGETQIKRRGQQISKVINNYYYTGREIEPETGDYYYRARYYDPNSQKFLSEDPIGMLSGDPNLYRYVNNMPLTFSDPSGTILVFGCDNAEKAFTDDLQRIMSTEEGKRLVSYLQNHPVIFTIHLSSIFRGQQWGTEIYVDPTYHPYVMSDLGPMAMSTTRVLAHELGHLGGGKDAGEGRMHNVNAWENPIMRPLEGWSRTNYGF